MSKLLIDEEPLQVLPSLAEAIGLNEAIFVQQLHYWLRKSKHEHDERVWIYNTYEEWHEQFPFWSLRTLQRIAARLVKLNLIIIHQFKKEDWDRRNWYSINYESPYLSGQKVPRQIGVDDDDKLALSENATLSAPMPPDWRLHNKDSETTTETTTEIPKSRRNSKSEATTPPVSFAITDDMQKWASSKVPNLDLVTETENFLDHHRAKGNRFIDWQAAWRTWMRNATGKYAPRYQSQAEMNKGRRGVVI